MCCCSTSRAQQVSHLIPCGRARCSLKHLLRESVRELTLPGVSTVTETQETMNQVKVSPIKLPEAASSQAAGIQEIRFPEPPDFEQLAQQTAQTVVRVLSGSCGEIPRCFYANPVVLVTAEYATEEFFRVVRKKQGEWCRRFKQVIGRRSTRRTRDWLSDGGGSQNVF